MQNATFDENPHENERIVVILGCAISSIARAKHGCTGGWLILCVNSRKICSILTDVLFMCVLSKLPYKIMEIPFGCISLGLNTLRPRQNGRHFADDISKSIFVNENV